MNKSFVTNKVTFTNESLGRQLKIKKEKLSRCYTTRIDEIIKINF